MTGAFGINPLKASVWISKLRKQNQTVENGITNSIYASKMELAIPFLLLIILENYKNI